MAMIVGDAKAIQAIDPVQLKDMLLHGAFDQDANGGSLLQVKQLSSQAFDEDGKQIVTAIAITKPTYDLPTAAVKAPSDVCKGQSTEDTTLAFDVAPSGANPKAAPFSPVQEPARPVHRGIATPEQFLRSFRQNYPPRKYAVEIKAPHRRIAFKNLPQGTTISDVLCLVHGGAVDRAWYETDNEIIVQFCDDRACKEYYDAYFKGIRVDTGRLITIEKPRGTEQIKPALKEKIDNGVTRVLHVSGIPKNQAFKSLLDAAAKYDVDHIVWRANGEENTNAWFLFANLTHAWEFKDQLQVHPAWEDTETEFLADPCKEAAGFHTNTPTMAWRMSSATVNTDTA